MKFFAIVMITNSHFKPIYSGSLVQLGIGGAFGCALFFFCSGFTMAYAKRDESFWQYFFRRIKRVYPSLWIFYLITCNFNNPLSWVLMDGYWFLQAIVVFYALFYFVRKYCMSYLPWIITGLLAAAVMTFELTSHSEWLIDLTYQPYYIHWMYYFAIMLIGAFIRIRGGYYLSNKFLGIIVLPMMFCVVYAYKYFCINILSCQQFQLLFPILLFVTCLASYRYMRDLTLENKYAKYIVNAISGITLEIYIVQFMCIKYCSTLSWPIRFVIAVGLIFVSAFMLNKLTALLTAYVAKLFDVVKCINNKE